MLELRGISKTFDQVQAVNQVNLTIKEGEFFSLLGPSGCGKTTLLRILAGFEPLTEGTLHWQNTRIDQMPPHQRQFNLVFQKYALFPHLNVFNNVAFGLKVKNVCTAEIKVRVDEALDQVKMTGFETRAVTTLSGGQQQRIALARALINKPKVLLLDEPLSALDLKLRQQMQMELIGLQRKLKTTFIFVTHDQDEALTLSDRIAVMNNGKIEQIGTPQEIYEYPRTPFVAQFIGTINPIEGQVGNVDATGLQVSVQTPFLEHPKRMIVVKPSRDGTRPLPVLSPGDPVQVLIRPEKLKVLKSQPSGEQNYVEGVLQDILYQGSMTQFFVRLKNGVEGVKPLILTALAPNSAVTAKKGFNLGEKIFLAWMPEDCILRPYDGS